MLYDKKMTSLKDKILGEVEEKTKEKRRSKKSKGRVFKSKSKKKINL